jgi:phosphoglycerate dehydrogenase-like enzyme
MARATTLVHMAAPEPRALLLAIDPAAATREDLARIRELLPDHDVWLGLDAGGDRGEVDRARIDIAAGWIAPERLLSLPSLRWYQQWFAGAEWLVDCPEAIERDFALSSASGISAAVVVEQALGYLLALGRRLPQAVLAQRERTWFKPPPDRFAQLAGKTMLVAGLGAIGSRLARVAAALDVRVLGIRRRPELPAEGAALVAGPERLLELLPEADVVVSAMPYTRETFHFFSADAFARVKPGAIFVSVGRGKVVDEAALVAALFGGRLAGAGLDVFEREPLPASSPLWGMEQVIVTPHWGAAFPGRMPRTMELFLDNLARFRAGQPLRNVIDKRRGY